MNYSISWFSKQIHLQRHCNSNISKSLHPLLAKTQSEILVAKIFQILSALVLQASTVWYMYNVARCFILAEILLADKLKEIFHISFRIDH